MEHLTWTVGGAQGEGIDSTGEIVSAVLNSQGYYFFAYRHFMSLIKGGHTHYTIRIADRPVDYHGDYTDILIAFDQRTLDEMDGAIHQDTIVVHDNSFEPHLTHKGVQTIGIPMSEFAKGLGNVIIKNMIAVGVSSALLGLKPELFFQFIEERFGSKGHEVVSLNKKAFQMGYDYQVDQKISSAMQLPKPRQTANMMISGNEAIGFGALAGGCRFLAAYPITPATEVMYWLVEHLPDFGGQAVQAEDEIAACLMAIGANYAGVRAMTSTSGPGFSLMQEAIGVAGINETPLVIVDVQRGGPATGLPTKTEQSDLNELLYGSHGEIPRIVLAPTTIEDCFYLTVQAFNLAERYQCPVLVASDLFMGMSKKSSAQLDFQRVSVERSGFLTDEELKEMDGTYHRYKVTSSGISPRSLPGQPQGMYVALSNEHDEVGREEAEDPVSRVTQMNKRMQKLRGLVAEDWGYIHHGSDSPEVLLIGFGSSYAQLHEAWEVLEGQGVSVSLLQLQRIAPLPIKHIEDYLRNAKQCLVVEGNYTGQLRQYLRSQLGFCDKLRSYNRFDGNPLQVQEIVDEINEVMAWV